MKNFLLLCMLVVLSYTSHGQYPLQIDTTFTNLEIGGINKNKFGITVKGNNTIVRLMPNTNPNYANATILVNGVLYDAVRMNSDISGSSSNCNLVTFAGNSDSVFVVSGSPELVVGQISTARARVTTVSNVDSTELAISFYNSLNSTNLDVKGSYLNDTILYLLVDGITNATNVEVVLNNGQPQPGTALTNEGAAIMKINRSTGDILKQVYLNHNSNDGFLNCTHFNTNSLKKIGNTFFFTSVNSLDENFQLHEYDMNLKHVQDIAIATDSASNDEHNHLGDRKIAYGVHDGEEYIGLIPKTIPVVVNLTTLDVTYIDAGSIHNKYFDPTVAALFVDSSFVFLHGTWIKRVELHTMTPSVIRRDWVSNTPTLNGHGKTTADKNARVSRFGFLNAKLVNGKIVYYARVKIYMYPASGTYINGDPFTDGSEADGDIVVFKGSIGLNPNGPAGNATVFSSSNCDSVVMNGNLVTYYVTDSSDIDSVHVIRTTGADNWWVSPDANDVVDFSNDTTIDVFSVDFPGPDISTIRTYVERAIFVRDTSVDDTSGIFLEELAMVEALYPNPFIDYLSIPDVYQNRRYGIILYDISGKIVFQERNIGNMVHGLQRLTSGVYLVHIVDGKGNRVSTQKLLK